MSAKTKPRHIEATAVYTVPEASVLIGLYPDTLTKKLRAGIIRGSRKLGTWRISGSELLRVAA